MDSQLERFEKALRQAMPPVQESGNLSLKVSNALGNAGSSRRVNLRFVYAFAATAVICLAFLVAPTVSAHATMQRMAGALDEVSEVKITDYAVKSDGSRIPVRSTSYSRGAWRRDEIATGRSVLFTDGRKYTFDVATNAFIVEERPDPMGSLGNLRLSKLVMQAGVGRDKKIQIEQGVPLHGRTFNRAVIDNPMFRERMSVYADAETDRPMYVLTEGQERGQWVLKSESVLDYKPIFAPDTFEPGANGTKVMTSQRWLDTWAARLTSQNLGSLPLDKGRLIIRDIFVDTDGAIFIAYQAQDMTPNQWTGYALLITDTEGTRYARQEVMGGLETKFLDKLPGGRLELEVFVPIEPVARVAGKFTLSATIDDRRSLVRSIPTEVEGPGGEKTYKMTPNWRSWNNRAAGLKVHHFGPFAKDAYKTSSLAAALPSIDDMFFGNPISKELYKSIVRTRHYTELMDVPNAKRWLYEQLRLCDEYEGRGYGPAVRSRIYDELDRLKDLGLSGSSASRPVTKQRR